MAYMKVKYFLSSIFILSLIMYWVWKQSEHSRKIAGTSDELKTNPPDNPYDPTNANNDLYEKYKRLELGRTHFKKELSFCNNPYGTICKDGEGFVNRHRKLVNKIRTIIMDDIFSNVLGEDVVQNISRDEYNSIVRIYLHDRHIFNQILRRTNKIVAEVLEGDGLGQNYGEIIYLMKEALRSIKGIDASTQDHLRGQINQIPILSPNKLLEYIERTGQSRNTPYESYIQQCGADGLAPNAFYVEASIINYHPPVIVLCPGFLLAARLTGWDHRQNIDSLIYVLSHEIAHSFVSRRLTYRKCNYSAYSILISQM